jgi:hypothetical protein
LKAPREIYGISVDDNREAWLNAVEKGGLAWPNVLAGDDPIFRRYSNGEVGTYILVRKDGLILYSGIELDTVEKIIAAMPSAQQ